MTGDAAESGPYTPQEAKDRGLVDDVGYFDDERRAFEQAVGAVRAEVRFGAGARSSAGDDLFDTVRAVTGGSLGGEPIVVVRAMGAISMEGGGAVPGGEGIVATRLHKTLTRLEKDDDVKAVVLRIDSPGGSALASDLLWHDLMQIRKRKALVVSVGGMAASGGYYLASSAARVFADETSIVGSIGVVGGKIAADHAFERIGIHAETFAAKADDAHAAARAAYESLFVPWDDDTRARVLSTMTAIYDLFLQRVSEGRGIPVARVAESAEGRIFSGREGLRRGLVDEIGGLREAIAHARSAAGLDAAARVKVEGEASGISQLLAGNEARATSAPSWLPSALVATAAAWLPAAASLAPIAAGEHVVCALPFGLVVR